MYTYMQHHVVLYQLKQKVCPHVVHGDVNCVCVMCVAPPTNVGVWSMAVFLGYYHMG